MPVIASASTCDATRSGLRSIPVARQLEKGLQRVLRDIVLDLGNQAEVAKQLGVDQATVSRWLAGRQGMDIGQCLRLAKLTRHSVSDLMIWAHHDPNDYLESGNLPPLSTDASRIAERVRILEWERRRNSIPEDVRPMADRAVDAVLSSYVEACDTVRKSALPPKPRNRRGD